MLHGLSLAYLYRTPAGGAGGGSEGLGPAGLAILGVRSGAPAPQRTLLLYDASTRPHATEP
jgi:hypothetical protein